MRCLPARPPVRPCAQPPRHSHSRTIVPHHLHETLACSYDEDLLSAFLLVPPSFHLPANASICLHFSAGKAVAAAMSKTTQNVTGNNSISDVMYVPTSHDHHRAFAPMSVMFFGGFASLLDCPQPDSPCLSQLCGLVSERRRIARTRTPGNRKITSAYLTIPWVLVKQSVIPRVSTRLNRRPTCVCYFLVRRRTWMCSCHTFLSQWWLRSFPSSLCPASLRSCLCYQFVCHVSDLGKLRECVVGA